MSRPIIITLVFMGMSWGLPAAAMFADEIEAHRDTYRQALTAIKAKNYTRFRELFPKLDGYILQSYAQYEYLKDRVATTPRETLHKFIEENTHAPVSEFLRSLWLYDLVHKGDWETLMEEYKNPRDDPKLHCYQLQRLLKTSSEQARLMSEIEKLWLTGKRLPSACNAVFEAWREAGHMTNDLIWARIKLAMERRNVSLARSLARRLPQAEQIWMRRWEAVHWNPNRELRRINYRVDDPVSRMIVKHGIVRLAYRDPEVAMQQWQELKERFQFFGEDENYVLRWLGVLAAQNHLPQALTWLSSVSANEEDTTLHLWRIKAALRAGEWETARHFLGALDEQEKQSPSWQYWRARILEASGNEQEAQAIYRLVAKNRGYYGFLAADRIDVDYAMEHESIEVEPEEITTMLLRPGIQAAYELYQIGDILQARRQWNWILKQMTNRELQVAAVIARHWGWYDRAIYTVNKSDHLDDLELRFPVAYRELVEANAERAGIDPSWIYGIMRQESAFVPDARSSAGALGLMQLMPATGRQVGRSLKMRIRSKASILDIENNVLLGSRYLKSVLDRNGGSQVLATASYNAGPHRVKRWLPEEKELDADVWVETIPFRETLDYVKNVLSFTAVYEHRLGEQPTPLSRRMPVVSPAQ